MEADVTLFPDLQEDAPEVFAEGGPFAAVALENSLDKLLDYSIPARLLEHLAVGQRVKVPLGKRNHPAFGYVISIHPTTSYPKIKPLMGIDDPRVLVDRPLMELARWMSRYYCAPLGTVIDSVIPSAVKRKIGVGSVQMVKLNQPRQQVQELIEKTKAPKRRAVLARLLQVEPDQSIELIRLAGEAGVTTPTVRKLVRLGLITITAKIDLPRFDPALQQHPATEVEIALNEDQQKVFDALRPKLSNHAFSVNLLLGVTGSGKTEVYLQCIREIVKLGRQAIVLVPEIALTPQTVRRFTLRFPRVAILHSGLTSTERHRYWQQIAHGHADVVVGARSAIFAPVPNLGMIVVDEEHEASYKQDSAPRYHGRDVAIKRAQLQDVPILLGSATPSLETYWRVNEGASAGTAQPTDNSQPTTDNGPRTTDIQPTQINEPRTQIYNLLSLPVRVRGLAMPHVELVDMKVANKFRRGVHLLSQRLEHLLRATIDSGHQAILLLNRRGYSNFVYCVSCQELIQCKYCDTTMTYHRSAGAHAKDCLLYTSDAADE